MGDFDMSSVYITTGHLWNFGSSFFMPVTMGKILGKFFMLGPVMELSVWGIDRTAFPNQTLGQGTNTRGYGVEGPGSQRMAIFTLIDKCPILLCDTW